MFDITRLLQPISDSQPCGEDLSFSTELDAIAHARKFDDPSLDQGEWTTELKEADWGFVVERCSDLIASRSKDLRLAAWLTEASAKVSHFRGLGDGYALLAGLCDQYWEGLYPLPDDGDQEQRIGNLSWLLFQSAQLVREMPITEGRHTAFSTVDFEAARLHAVEAEKLGADASKSVTGPPLAEVEAARHKSSRAFYEVLLADSQYCMESLCQLEKSVDARLGIDGPGFSSAKDALDGVIRFVSPMVRETGGNIAGQAAEEMSSPLEEGVQGGFSQSMTINGPIQTRAQALAQLRMVADFFRRTEPHSPVAYLADKAAAWGNLPLHAWLRLVVKDQSSLAHIEELLGSQGSPDNN